MSDVGKLFTFLLGILWTVSTILFICFTPPSILSFEGIEVRIKTESILISKFSMPEVFLHSPHACLLDNCTIKLFSVQAHILYYSSYQWNFCQALWNQIRGRAQKKSVILTIKIAFAMDDVKNLNRSSSWVSTKSFSGYSFEE